MLTRVFSFIRRAQFARAIDFHTTRISTLAPSGWSYFDE
ncbi:unnamed protein product [Amoebophrya sp. A25]|nr:unnamed protein product [Amoebophrya sp. A25]|eukprot:GSA25T00004194001.1